jgi:hypothetical protein
LKFLDDSSGNDVFQNAPANDIENAALRAVALSSEDEVALHCAARTWIRTHRRHDV